MYSDGSSDIEWHGGSDGITGVVALVTLAARCTDSKTERERERGMYIYIYIYVYVYIVLYIYESAYS